LNGYTKTRNHRKTLRKTQKNNNLLKPKECKYQNTTPVFTFSLAVGQGGSHPSGGTVATHQLCHWSGAFQTWIATSSSDIVTRRIGTIQQTQDATCFEYNDTTVGMPLDQPSYWDSWKLVGRSWRYYHESWI